MHEPPKISHSLVHPLQGHGSVKLFENFYLLNKLNIKTFIIIRSLQAFDCNKTKKTKINLILNLKSCQEIFLSERSI